MKKFANRQQVNCNCVDIQHDNCYDCLIRIFVSKHECQHWACANRIEKVMQSTILMTTRTSRKRNRVDDLRHVDRFLFHFVFLFFARIRKLIKLCETGLEQCQSPSKQSKVILALNDETVKCNWRSREKIVFLAVVDYRLTSISLWRYWFDLDWRCHSVNLASDDIESIALASMARGRSNIESKSKSTHERNERKGTARSGRTTFISRSFHSTFATFRLNVVQYHRDWAIRLWAEATSSLPSPHFE